jgi:hypothetical protein
MQKFLFVPTDTNIPAYSRDYVNPDEFKKAIRGLIRIFEILKDDEIINEYNEADDVFENEVARKW